MVDWRITEIGNGAVRRDSGGYRLTVGPTLGDSYSDAQISDYIGRKFSAKPPLRMTLRAYATPGVENLRGTAGFGFWNHPFVPGATRLPRLPQTLWFFFSSPPNNMRLADGVPGPGWKAATFDAKRWQFLALAPATPVGILLTRIPALYKRLWPIGQHALGVSEHLLDSNLLSEPRTYTLNWRERGATFAVDGVIVHESPYAPHGPLGFVAWIDNQYAVVTPQGRFGFGLVPVERQQTLVIESVELEQAGA